MSDQEQAVASSAHPLPRSEADPAQGVSTANPAGVSPAPVVSMESMGSEGMPVAASDGGGVITKQEPAAPSEAPLTPEEEAALVRQRPGFLSFGIIAGVALLCDVLAKAWAELALSSRLSSDPSLVLIKDQLTLTLAYNRGGAWGLLQDADKQVRGLFFPIVSVAAIAFIVSLYSRLSPHQKALRWGLPLVLGGALGNFTDRIVRGSVIDFIDYRADWVHEMNVWIARLRPGWGITDHWPTFNIADVCICVGVGLMALDMFIGRRRPAVHRAPLGPVAPPTTPVAPAG